MDQSGWPDIQKSKILRTGKILREIIYIKEYILNAINIYESTETFENVNIYYMNFYIEEQLKLKSIICQLW